MRSAKNPHKPKRNLTCHRKNSSIYRSYGTVLLPSNRLIIQDPNYGKAKKQANKQNDDHHFRIDCRVKSRIHWKMIKEKTKTIIFLFPPRSGNFKFENQKRIQNLDYKSESRCFGFGDSLFWAPKIQNRILYNSKGNPSIVGSMYGICILNSHICPKTVKHIIYYNDCHIFVIK